LADIVLGRSRGQQQATVQLEPTEVERASPSWLALPLCRPGALGARRHRPRHRGGESVAIVGPSGCGKTTLVNAILASARGRRRSDDRRYSVKQMGFETLRGMIGTVMQDDSLFAGSITDNISFFDKQGRHERVEACANWPRSTRKSSRCRWATRR
jgi:predicted ATPase